jgi:hypothetical protein
MAIDAASGMIVWTPQVGGSFGVVVEASNTAGSHRQSFTIFGQPVPAPGDLDPSGAAVYESGRSVGYYLWRESGGKWRLRLNSDGLRRNLSGTIVSSGTIQAWPFSLESNDSLTVSGGKITFNCWMSNSHDGIDFRVDPGAVVTFDLRVEWSNRPIPCLRRLRPGQSGPGAVQHRGRRGGAPASGQPAGDHVHPADLGRGRGCLQLRRPGDRQPGTGVRPAFGSGRHVHRCRKRPDRLDSPIGRQLRRDRRGFQCGRDGHATVHHSGRRTPGPGRVGPSGDSCVRLREERGLLPVAREQRAVEAQAQLRRAAAQPFRDDRLDGTDSGGAVQPRVERQPHGERKGGRVQLLALKLA